MIWVLSLYKKKELFVWIMVDKSWRGSFILHLHIKKNKEDHMFNEAPDEHNT